MSQQIDLKKRKYLLMLSLSLNLGLLAVFKYANFFVENIQTILVASGSSSFAWTNIALPIGISFYTFQTLTYSVDVYRKVHAPLRSVKDYLLYIMMFPQLIAGPIVRFNTIADQIEHRVETHQDKLQGFYRFCIGLAKKVLIANVLGEVVLLLLGEQPGISTNWASLNSSLAWCCLLAYTFQIYFDFSGYSDMAIGLGKMMGFSFPENFDNPYNSRSISEFWRRWHITLGAFMRAYLYIPLGGSRVARKSRLYVNLWLVFLLSGLWHGASWNFVIWGAFHGFFLVLERAFLAPYLQGTTVLHKLLSLIYCFWIVMLGWVFFIFEDLTDASQFIQLLFSFSGEKSSLVIPFKSIAILFVAGCFSFCTLFQPFQLLHNWVYNAQYQAKSMPFIFTVALLLFVLCCASVATSSYNPFIYYRF
jgi:alginate O-acetyltransferase complex protein AlgI